MNWKKMLISAGLKTDFNFYSFLNFRAVWHKTGLILFRLFVIAQRNSMKEGFAAQTRSTCGGLLWVSREGFSSVFTDRRCLRGGGFTGCPCWGLVLISCHKDNVDAELAWKQLLRRKRTFFRLPFLISSGIIPDHWAGGLKSSGGFLFLVIVTSDQHPIMIAV